mgnify:FL=1
MKNPKLTSRTKRTRDLFFPPQRAFSHRHRTHQHQQHHVDNISFFIQQQQQQLRLLSRDCDCDDEVFDFATKTKRVVLERVYFEFFSFHVFFPKRRRVFVFTEGEWLS